MASPELISSYCERRGPGPFDEPLNTITNLAFILAATHAWNLAARHRIHAGEIRLLILLSATIGVGSAIFHACPAPWTRLMDLVPILLFQLCFLWLYLRRCAGIRSITAAVLLSAYLVCSVLLSRAPPWLNGSVLYAPTIAAMAGLAAFHYCSGQPDRWLMAIAAVVFCAALTFRTIDQIACPYIPCGTHFLWHLLNGLVVSLAMRVMILTAIQRRLAQH